MASQSARADPVASREESGESVEGSVAPVSVGGVDVGREGVGADAPHPPGGAQWQGYRQSMHRSFRWLSKPKLKLKHSYLHRRMHPLQRQHQQFLRLTVIMKESGRWELQNSRVL
ncbi:UNVERIFIED_CONTAM: hypothetical protein Sradi_0580400 [Sesamum radiatum]|uniref:Uncharacterized protein n=1 Tax=Sesamum radiatum TaxID=300843 RepID=A0AAW2T5K1_SESRA